MSVRLIYIMGDSRSGSTLLDVLLGSHSGIRGLGELAYFVDCAWSSERFCGCRELVAKCPFWSDVRARWEAECGVGVHETYSLLRTRFEKLRNYAFLFSSRLRSLRGFDQYIRLTEALFSAISQAAPDQILVDSSKYPVRALALSLVPSLEVHLVHLVRDVRGVVASKRKAFERDPTQGLEKEIRPRPVLKTLFQWWLVNRVAESVSLRAKTESTHFLRYEDLMRDSCAALESLGAAVGKDLSEIASSFEQGREISIGHVVAGNRLRMHGTLRKRPDSEWRRSLTATQQKRICRLARPPLTRYRYLDS